MRKGAVACGRSFGYLRNLATAIFPQRLPLPARDPTNYNVATSIGGGGVSPGIVDAARRPVAASSSGSRSSKSDRS